MRDAAAGSACRNTLHWDVSATEIWSLGCLGHHQVQTFPDGCTQSKVSMMQVDFMVVGAGISGASAAFELASHGPVLLVEAETFPGYHATGRSAALFTPHQGTPLVQAINRASAAFYATPPAGFAEQPLVTPRGGLTIAEPGQEGLLDALIAQSADGREVTEISTAAALALAPLLRPERIGAAVHEPGIADINVSALHQGYLRGLKQRGGVLICNQRIKALSHQHGVWTAQTNDTNFKARVIVNAAGAWADHLAGLGGARPIGLVPKRRTAILVDGLPDVDTRTMPIVDFTSSNAYLKPDGRRIMSSLGDQDPVDAQDIRPEELQVALLADWLQRETLLTIRRIDHSWAGLRSFVADESPVVGYDDVAPEFFWLAGQGGFGIMMAPLLAKATAALVLGQELPHELTSHGITAQKLHRSRAGLQFFG